MQTREKAAEKQTDSKSDTNNQKAKSALVGTAFFAALLLFALINFSLTAQGIGKKRNPNDVLRQATLEKQSGNASRHTWAWWLTRLYEEEKQAPDVVFFGSSLLGSAHATVDAQTQMKLVDVLTHRKLTFFEDQLSKRIGHNVSTFSLGSPGEMISDAYVISKTLFAAKKPKLVVATIAPRDFIDSTLLCPAATDHFKFFSNYLDLSEVTNEAYPDFFARMGQVLEQLPLKHLSKHMLSEYSERPQSDWEQCESTRMEAGKAVVPAYALPAWADNSKEYKERFKNPNSPNYKSELKFFKLWLNEMKANGIDVMVVNMPTTELNRKLLPEKFWSQYRADISAVCQENKAYLFDLSDCGLFNQRDYLDTVHLNVYGGLKLFPVIAEHICTHKLCPKL